MMQVMQTLVCQVISAPFFIIYNILHLLVLNILHMITLYLCIPRKMNVNQLQYHIYHPQLLILQKLKEFNSLLNLYYITVALLIIQFSQLLMKSPFFDPNQQRNSKQNVNIFSTTLQPTPTFFCDTMRVICPSMQIMMLYIQQHLKPSQEFLETSTSKSPEYHTNIQYSTSSIN